MAFEDFSRQGRCEVCGSMGKVVCCSSSVGACSFAYCKECFDKRMEPYGALVPFVACSGKWPDAAGEWWINHIRQNLKYLGRTEEEFAHDVDHAFDEYNEWLQSQDGVTSDYEDEFEPGRVNVNMFGLNP